MTTASINSVEELEIASCLFDMSKSICRDLPLEEPTFSSKSDLFSHDKARDKLEFDSLNKSIVTEGYNSNCESDVKGVDIVGDLIMDPACTDELMYGQRILLELMGPANRLYNWQFLHAVDEREAPFYYEKIKQPMWLKQILERFDSKYYKSIVEFVDDFKLIVKNAIEYNGPMHPVSKKAKKLEIMLYQKLNLFPSFIKDKFKYRKEKSPVKNTQKIKSEVSAEKSEIIRRRRIESAQRNRAKKLRRIEIIKNSRINFYETLQAWEEDLMKDCSYKTLWQLPQIGLFLKSTFTSLKVAITQYELERCFLLPLQSSALDQIMTALLFTNSTRKQLTMGESLSYDEWHVKLKATLSLWFKSYNENAKNSEYVFQKYGVEKEFFIVFGDKSPLQVKEFKDLIYAERVWIVKSLCDYILETQKALVMVMDNLPSETLRPTILGRDCNGLEYIYFHQFVENDIRIYKQTSYNLNTVADDEKIEISKNYSSEEDEMLSSINSVSEDESTLKEEDFFDKEFTLASHNLPRSYNTRSTSQSIKHRFNASDSNHSMEPKTVESRRKSMDNIANASIVERRRNESLNNLLSTPRRSLRKVMEESKRDVSPIKSNQTVMMRDQTSKNLRSRNAGTKLRSRNNKDLIGKIKLTMRSNEKLKSKGEETATLIGNKRGRKNKSSYRKDESDGKDNLPCISDDQMGDNMLVETNVDAKEGPEIFEMVVENLEDLSKLIDNLTNQIQTMEDENLNNKDLTNSQKLLKSLKDLYSDLQPSELHFQQIIKKKKVDMRREHIKYEQQKKQQLYKENQLKRQQDKVADLKSFSGEAIEDSNHQSREVKDENVENNNSEGQNGYIIFDDEVNLEPARKIFKKSLFEPGEILEKRTRVKCVAPLAAVNKNKRSTRATNPRYREDYACHNHPFFSENFSDERHKLHPGKDSNEIAGAGTIEVKGCDDKRFIKRKTVKTSIIEALISKSITSTNNNVSNTATTQFQMQQTAAQKFAPFIPNLLRNQTKTNDVLNKGVSSARISAVANSYKNYTSQTSTPSNSFAKLMDKTILANYQPKKLENLSSPNSTHIIGNQLVMGIKPESKNISPINNIQFVNVNGQPISITSLNKLLNASNQQNKILLLNTSNINNQILNINAKPAAIQTNTPIFQTIINRQTNNQTLLNPAILNNQTTPLSSTTQPILYFVKSQESNQITKLNNTPLIRTNIATTPLSNYFMPNYTPVASSPSKIDNPSSVQLTIHNTNSISAMPMRTSSTILLPATVLTNNLGGFIPGKFNLKTLNGDVTNLSSVGNIGTLPLGYIGNLKNGVSKIMTNTSNAQSISSNIFPDGINDTQTNNLINLGNIQKLYFSPKAPLITTLHSMSNFNSSLPSSSNNAPNISSLNNC